MRRFPVITVLAVNIGWLLSGAVIVETVFTIHGLGSQLVRSVGFRDYFTVQGLALVFSVLVMIDEPRRRSRLHGDRPARGAGLTDGDRRRHREDCPLAGRIGRELGAWPPSLKIGGAIFLAIMLAGIFAPLLTPYDPYYQDLQQHPAAASLGASVRHRHERPRYPGPGALSASASTSADLLHHHLRADDLWRLPRRRLRLSRRQAGHGGDAHPRYRHRLSRSWC